MPEKILLIVMDGLGDRPLKELLDQTPLEAAEKPNLNKLARRGITGLMNTIGVGVMPGSDIAQLALLGFEPEKAYFGRGPLEALGINFPLKEGDIAFRANFAALNENGIVIDRRAGKLDCSKELCKLLDGIIIDKVKFSVAPGLLYRAVLVLHGKGLSAKVSGNDPVKGLAPGVFSKEPDQLVPEKVIPLDSSKEAKFTAQVLNKFYSKAQKILETAEFNKKRNFPKQLPANCFLFRSPGVFVKEELFEKKFGLKAACVAGGPLYKGVGRAIGMKVFENPAFTGTASTDLNLKVETAVNALKDFDFVFLHLKATDSFGEAGDFWGKKEFIERVDKACRALPELQNTVIAVTGDHSTPCILKKHSADPVPLLVFGPGIRTDPVTNFSERSCAHGAIGRIKGVELVPELINLAGRSKIYGA